LRNRSRDRGQGDCRRGHIVVTDIAVSPASKVGSANYEAMIEDLKYEIEFIGAGGTGGPISTGNLYWHNAMGKVKVPVPKPLDPVTEKPHDERARYEGGTVELFPPGAFIPQSGKPLLLPLPPLVCTKSVDVVATVDLSDPLVP
jgi:hypothetical protein